MRTTNLFWSSCCVNLMASTWSVKCKVTNIVLPFFFKSNCNPDNGSPLVIPPKFLAMPSSKESSNINKVASNSKSKSNNLLCNWCAWVVYQPSFPLLHLICMRSKFWQTKKTNNYWNNLIKTMMSFTSAETFELHSFRGQKCSKVILERLTMWSALCVQCEGKWSYFGS